MIECFYDLHIHTGLSPCCEDDMSPNNIVNMAIIKGLDIIAITDHNSALNVEVTIEVAKNTNLLVIPGIEVESFEGIHLLCYFKTVSELMQFAKIVDDYLPNIKNDETLWGKQLIFNEDDEIIAIKDKALLNSVNLKIDEIINLTREKGGIVIPAHVNRFNNSILTILGFIPKDLPIAGIEVANNEELKDLNYYRIIRNSDAHFLGHISERINKIILPEKSLNAFFDYFGDKS
ncbi:MAG TPA: PHP domain-containing protein [Haloplasmataceae bacterium]